MGRPQIEDALTGNDYKFILKMLEDGILRPGEDLIGVLGHLKAEGFGERRCRFVL